MNILSLFDGVSCGQLALKRAGIKVDNYYASEIDKYAIKVTMNNFPETIQLGDITKVDPSGMNIDLLIGGSPCQGFSFAGKQLNFDDPRSKLFFEYVRILKEIRRENPNILFLLENVKMKKEFQDIISQELGVESIEINSALVSAQNRRRLYWTNIRGVKQPDDKGILLKDIIESGDVDREKSMILMTTYHNNGESLKRYYEKGMHQIVFKEKSQCILSTIYKENKKSMLKRGKLGLLTGDCSKDLIRKLSVIECERLQTLPDNYTQGISNTQRYKAIGNGWTVDVISHIFSFLPK